jgi:LmbE family N-acetylglucosaminyl deacetylase
VIGRSTKARLLELCVRTFVVALNLLTRSRKYETPHVNNYFKHRAALAILVPHPDDEVLGCYHFLERFGSAMDIDLIYVTDAVDDIYADVRRNESLQACKDLAIRRRVRWRFPDGDLTRYWMQLSTQLDEIERDYDFVLCPSVDDRTADHKVLADGADQAISPDKLIWYRSTWLTFTLHAADFVVTGSEKKKRAAIRCFKTQKHVALQNAITISSLEARRCGLGATSAEGFRLASSDVIDVEPINVLSIRSLWRKRDLL